MSTEDVYVAKCLRVFSSYAAGIRHERECTECRREEEDEEQLDNEDRLEER